MKRFFQPLTLLNVRVNIALNRVFSLQNLDESKNYSHFSGYLAQQLELAILHAVAHRGAVLGHKAQIEKFDGYSEAWTKDSLTVTSFKQLLDWVYDDDH